MDYETVSAADFGRALKGLGVNILTRDVKAKVAFLTEVFAMQAHRVTADFAILTYGGEAVFQVHADHTYHSHPLPALLPEAGARGGAGGVELRLYDTDPDAAAARGEAFGATLLQRPRTSRTGCANA